MASTLTAPSRLEHQPALDGLRGFAVTAVVLYHQDPRWLHGGYLGVDVFFVLSGFLITSLLLIDRERTGRIVSLRFWERRARRLLPALLVLVVLVALYSAFAADSIDVSSIRVSGLATIFYFANYYQVYGHPISNSPLSHMWSLSVEEQFYLLWPPVLAVLVVWTHARKRWLIAAILTLAAASALLMAARYSTRNTFRAFGSTETHGQSLLVGAALGVALLAANPLTKRVRLAVDTAGVAALVVLVTLMAAVPFFSSSWLYHGGYLAVAICAAMVIAAAVQPGTLVGRVFSFRPLTSLGLISYGVYLFHIPIFLWLSPDRISLGNGALFVLRTLVTLAVALASFFLVEMPIRRSSRSRARFRLGAPIAIAVVVGLLLVGTRGASEQSFRLQATALRNQAKSTPVGARKVLVAGDGLALSLYDTYRNGFTGGGIRGSIVTINGCGIVPGGPVVRGVVSVPAPCQKWQHVYREAVDAFRPDVVVLMASTNEVLDRVVGSRLLRAGTPELAAYLRRQLDLARAALTGHGAKFVLLTAPCMDRPPNAPPDPPLGSPLGEVLAVLRARTRTDWLSTVWRDYAAQHSSVVQIADYAGFLCPAGTSPATRAKLRSDNGLALSRVGATETWRWIARVVADANP